MLNKGYAVMDLETNGLHVVGCRITEIAVLLALPGEEPRAESYLVKIDQPVPEEIVELTGITETMLQEEGVAAQQALLWFVDRVGGLPIVCHNVFRFDRPFLLNEIARNCPGLDPAEAFPEDRFIDTAAIVKGRKLGLRRKRGEPHPNYAMRVLETQAAGVTYSLEASCLERGIPTDDLTLHRALGDVTLTHRLFEALLRELGVATNA